MDSKELWVGLFTLGILFFNWPFLKIFGNSLPSYLFIFWTLFIAAVGIFSTLADRKDKGG